MLYSYSMFMIAQSDYFVHSHLPIGSCVTRYVVLFAWHGASMAGKIKHVDAFVIVRSYRIVILNTGILYVGTSASGLLPGFSAYYCNLGFTV